ncbi:hypothetical protein M1P56_35370 (plasmid) [Streptomyces sp. HU2014]|uniref:hypothetical protein n=1 Tax=Streptomyces sp. HU2014 TaxID=2939414 RepID=UPI0020107A6E|nr:hypothetical protein [Streptomyces sp. HU2014]UQI49672.1 hypothetical protein M1P56_35370 [Streptomyces sp. HU2014]
MGVRGHLISVQVVAPVSPDSLRQLGADSPVSLRLIVLVMAQGGQFLSGGPGKHGGASTEAKAGAAGKNGGPG